MNIVTIEGGYRVPNDSHVGKWCIESQKLCHDDFLPFCAAQYIKKGDRVIDAGAFCGDHTILYSEIVGEMGRVFAFEPGSIAFQCLDHNVQLFPIRNTEVYNVALSDNKGFAKHMEDSNLGASSCIEGESGGVQVETIDSLILGRISFIKMDCEGFELKVLKGAELTLKTYKPILLLEINPSALERQGNTPEEVFDYLGELGYSFFCVQSELRSNEPQFDVICECI